MASRDEGSAQKATLGRILAALRRHGLLLKQDKLLPNVVSLVTGEALAASWWGHARAKEIFALLQELSERADVLETKLIAGKVTYVLEPLWPAWLGIVTSGEDWQIAGLSVAAQRVLAQLNQQSELEAKGAVVKELEQGLLVRSAQRHTQAGQHVLVLESWGNWAKRCAVSATTVLEGKAAFERAAASLGAPLSALPWHAKRRAGRNRAL